MDILLLVITIVSLIVALVMSVTAWRLVRAEKQRAAARVAALSVAAHADVRHDDLPLAPPPPAVKSLAKAPWSTPRLAPVAPAAPASPDALHAPTSPVSAGFLGAAEVPRQSGGGQKSLALAAVVLFAVMSGVLTWTMSGPRGTSAAAMGPNAPLELMSLSHERQNDKLAVSGLVRNPVAGQPVEKLSAVVFLFDRAGTFVTSARAGVDFLKLAAGDESPFVVSLDAPATVARYRVSFRTDEGVVPHVDRRGAAGPAEGEQTVNVTVRDK